MVLPNPTKEIADFVKKSPMCTGVGGATSTGKCEPQFALTNTSSVAKIMRYDCTVKCCGDAPKDAKHPLLSSPYFTLLARWQYDKILAKYEFLFKEDMQRANESIVEQNKKHHESFVSQNYKVDVGNSKSFSKS